MIKSFKSKALAELWSTSKTTKIDGRLHARILRRLDALDKAAVPDELNVPGFNFHKNKWLQSDKVYDPHQWSMVYNIRI